MNSPKKRRHILYLDPIEKLVVSKDSTLLLALSLKKRNEEVFLLFTGDLYLTINEEEKFKLWNFEGEISDDFTIKRFVLKDARSASLERGDLFHMRRDPPLDRSYFKDLWILRIYQERGIEVLNDPSGILSFCEKIVPFSYPEKSTMSYVGESYEGYLCFIKKIKDLGFDNMILKPLDLFQGIGIEKISINSESESEEFFKKHLEKRGGALLVQPFLSSIFQGEVRSVFFDGKHLGSILKTPPENDFLANVAQGASYKVYELNPEESAICREVSHDLLDHGIRWVAFDLIDSKLSEVNVTCPGLLVEVSKRSEENLAFPIIDLID